MKDFKCGVQINFYHHLSEWQKTCVNQQDVQQDTVTVDEIALKDFNINVLDILKNHIDGRILLSFFAEKKTLEDQHRHLICNVIVEHFIKLRPNKNLTVSECKLISNQIINLFPGEVQVINFHNNLLYINTLVRFYIVCLEC